MRLSIALVLAILLGAGRPVLAQTDARLSARLDATTASRVQAAVNAAASEGLPTEPLVLKALEGASKGARAAQIVAVVGRLRSQLLESRTALGRDATAEEIVAGSATLQAGVAATKLREMRDARARGSLVTALSVLTDLLARGVPVETAANAVTDLLRTGATDAQLVAFQRGVERDIATGLPAAVAARRGAGGVPAAVPVTPGRRQPPTSPGSGRPPAS